MSWSASKSWKCCASCANWGGPRTAKYNKDAEVESPSVRGKCYANVFCGVTQGPSASEGRSCSKYQTWAAIQ